ncbi:thioredoxin domain-containing protein [Candidatus Azambacteria bacterium]|nr:thioredoxin domain-containing protein [Candidatus Azambacteria bacterium]MBI3685098.1 thioredoxin domain-containing protein [Candidatus Azambacteria bacterium]
MENETKPSASVSEPVQQSAQANSMSVPASIIAAGVIIAIAIIYSNGGGNTGQLANTKTTTVGQAQPGAQAPAAQNGSAIKFRAISDSDHILGDKNAQVKVIEYSDLECPFCKRFHPTMQQVMTEYQGKVAWVYRHFPLDSLHAKARKEAEASECANELGGNDTFWVYINRVYEVTPSNNGLDAAELPKIAEYVGLNKAKFSECFSSSKHASYVEADVQDAMAAGGRGTPYSVVVSKSGKTFPINGALPYAQVKTIIDQALAN